MRHVVRKMFYNYEKEEKWLNEMAAKGISLVQYSWCKYVFEDTANGEYIYRIILFDHPISHPETSKCIQFIEETGAEYVSSYMCWVYFRKKASQADGEFEIYSDIDSRIKHNKRISSFFWMLTLIQVFPALQNIIIILDGNGHMVNSILATVPLVLAGMFIWLGLHFSRNIRKLKKEKAIRES
jgi:hypothetical protein